MMNSSVVTIKGQIVIPVEIRKKVGINPGTKVFLEEKNGDIIVHPATASFYDRYFGMFKNGGLLKALETERKKEKKREDSKIAQK